MDRHRSSFLALITSLSLASACAPDLPISYVVDERFSESQATTIRAQAEKWNRVTTEWLDQAGFVYLGRFQDSHFDPYDDLSGDRDGPKRIYYGYHNHWLKQLTEIEGGDPEDPSALGYNFGTAIVIWLETCTDFKPLDACLTGTALHELGHALGMTHLRGDTEGIMAEYDARDKPAAIMADDIRMLCVAHECLKDPP